MRIRLGHAFASVLASTASIFAPMFAAARQAPQPVTLGSGWQMQFANKVPHSGAEIASASFDTNGWYAATVPGTVLTTLVDNHVYPEPLYGENIRAENIPDGLAYESYWYRTTIAVPKSYGGRHIWLNFDGINFSAEVWVNGANVGTIRGAFIRGIFDVTAHVTPGSSAVVAVLIKPQPHPGAPHLHTVRLGIGPNGGLSALDGPTFLSTIGWDWLPTIPDRDTGIWQKVYLSATGPVTIQNPFVVTDLPLPRTDSADLTVQATVENVTDQAQQGELDGEIGKIKFSKTVNLAPHAKQLVSFDAKDTPVLHIENPRLWWPNGYGAQNLYSLHLSFNVGHDTSDENDVPFGVRKITYSVPGTNTLTISVNGVPVFIRGGDWGLDEGLKRIPRARLDAQIHLHQLAHLNLIRNWVGQSTSEDFYELCDKYGILVWDEFFQPNPNDGPDPDDVATYLDNVRDKLLRFRNHPSIALWCARNEGDPPPEIDTPLRKMLAELDPTRLYQPSSTSGHGVRSHGPYYWRVPRDFYRTLDDFFKTETGSVSIPTLESIHAMMPEKDWNSINDDWAEHDFARGNSGSDKFPDEIAARYGPFRNLADFVRKSQMADYEAFRAMYEGRNALLFSPATAVITWMSNPAQPSFVWQIYDYYLEPFGSFFGVMHASEMQHIQFNQANDQLQVINNLPTPLTGATAHVAIYNLDGSQAAQYDVPVTAPAEAATNFGEVKFPATLSQVHFIDLTLRDAQGATISNNFYWRALPAHLDDYRDLQTMPMVTLEMHAKQKDSGGERTITVTLHNPTQHIALMAHVQLRRASGERVLPVSYSDNYVSLIPDQTTTIVIRAAVSDFDGQKTLIAVDGWNTTVAEEKSGGVSIEPNRDAEPDQQPATGFAVQTAGLR
ncbi:MAG TPA: glycoside hydrolase family 2 TIM barrel-domain containing protein [Terracidiphilus sp.]